VWRLVFALADLAGEVNLPWRGWWAFISEGDILIVDGLNAIPKEPRHIDDIEPRLQHPCGPDGPDLVGIDHHRTTRPLLRECTNLVWTDLGRRGLRKAGERVLTEGLGLLQGHAWQGR
jgi:hypothetical protein